MNIGMIDVDGLHFPNLALMKLSRYHKQRGDEVEWYTPFAHYDLVYMAKVFTFTPDYGYLITNADEVVKGGTGYDMHSKLPDEVDMLQPDYSLYPSIDNTTAYGFLTRGCSNKCFWCVVPTKEGGVKPYMSVDEIAIEGRKNLVLMDNNILASGDYALEQFEKIIDRGCKVDFNQAIDARLVNETNAELLAKVKWSKYIRFGCDTHKQIEDCERAIALLERFGYLGDVFLYTMIGGKNDFDECLERINYWRNRLLDTRKHRLRCETHPFAQPYRDPTKHNHEIPQWQRDMARWCNNKALFTNTDFRDYEPRKGFKCREYEKH